MDRSHPGKAKRLNKPEYEDGARFVVTGTGGRFWWGEVHGNTSYPTSPTDQAALSLVTLIAH